MSLIKIKDSGYGIDGKTLDLIIAIPQGSYLTEFWVANQNDITADNSTHKGVEYIKAIQNINKNMTKKDAFLELFTYLDSYTSKEDGNTYDRYRINPSCASFYNNKARIGITVSQNDLTFITMKVIPQGYGYGFKYSTECGADNTEVVFPLYNLMCLRLRALSYAQFIGCSCDIPLEFIDKILQIEAIKLSICSGNYYKAATYWNKFYGGKNIATNIKRCNCHG